MTRQQRRTINRANAKLSTGPTTETGKDASKMNATKHSLTSMTPYLPGEEAAYEAFAAAQCRAFEAATDGEIELLQTIIETKWRLERIAGLEARLFADPDTDPHKLVRSLDTLSRHETRLRKLILKTIEILILSIQLRRKAQQQNDLSANGFVLQNAEGSTGLRACDHPMPPEFELDEAQQAA